MTLPKLADEDGPMHAFLVERYLSATAAQDLPASIARLGRLCADLDRTDTPVRYLYSAYLPAEDTCFCLFRAASSAAVSVVNNRAHFAFDRITEASLLVCVVPEVPVVATATAGPEQVMTSNPPVTAMETP